MTAVLHYVNPKQHILAMQMTETNGRELAAWSGGAYSCGSVTYPRSLPCRGVKAGGWVLLVGTTPDVQLMSARMFAETYIVDEGQGTFRHRSMRTTVWRVRKVLGRWRVNCPDGTTPCRCAHTDTFEDAWRMVEARSKQVL